MFKDTLNNINPLILIIAVVVILYVMTSLFEPFSDSGMPISNEYCVKLADVYYRPSDSENRDDYRNRICGNVRRHSVDPETGNYFTENGIII